MKLPISIFVAAGGFLGGISRYLVTLWSVSIFPSSSFPLGTFSVNIVGCFLMGLLLLPQNITYIKAHHHYVFSKSGQAFVCIGFLASFTTFSSFGLESYEGLTSIPEMLLMDIFLQLFVGIIFVYFGVFLKKAIWKV